MSRFLYFLAQVCGLLCTLFMTAMLGSIFALFLSGCGKEYVPGPAGPQGVRGVRGDTGETGPAGADANIDVITPCPNVAGAHPEVLWRIDGVVYAVYASGQKIHLSALQSNTQYQTTDGRNCLFTISPEGDIVY